MNTFRNVISYWLLLGKNSSGEAFAAWCALSSLMMLVGIGFGTLAWHFPMAGLIVFLVVFMPMFIQVYLKFNDKAIDARIEELRQLTEKYKSRRSYF